MFDFFEDMNKDHGCLGVIIAVVIILALVFGLLCLEAWCLMALWNSCAVPAIMSLNQIGFWQAWGISILSNILFKNIWSGSKKKD